MFTRCWFPLLAVVAMAATGHKAVVAEVAATRRASLMWFQGNYFQQSPLPVSLEHHRMERSSQLLVGHLQPVELVVLVALALRQVCETHLQHQVGQVALSLVE